jgi:hypothetical protein
MQEVISKGQDELASRVDEEDIRLSTGFADIFTAIMLGVSAFTITAVAFFFSPFIICAAAFLLGKPLIQNRQFAASAITLTLCMAFSFGMIGLPFAGVIGEPEQPTLLLSGQLMSLVFLIIGAIATGFYWKIYKVPIALAMTYILVTISIIYIGATSINTFTPIRAIITGFVLFGIALYYDAQDRLRQTRLSDVAFWLHLASAPFIVHGLFTALGYKLFQGEMASSTPVFVIFAVLIIISLIIDRRPILVSSLSYLFLALYQLVPNEELSANRATYMLNVALAPGIIGIGILFLAAGWTPLRRLLLKLLPNSISQYVPAADGAYAAPSDDRTSLPKEETEPLRLVLGFNDFFVAIGCGSLCLGMIILGASLSVPSSFMDGREAAVVTQNWLVWPPIILPAISMWLAAEYFVRIRRMAWPAITTAFWFALLTISVGYIVAIQMIPDIATFELNQNLTIALVITACLTVLALNLLFWWRHRVPISFAFAIAGLIPLFFVDYIMGFDSESFRDSNQAHYAYRFIIAGFVIFAGAMWWDRKDVARQTQRADTAFWLHLLAACLYIPALFMLVLKDNPFVLILAFFVLIIMAVIIDRRAPLAVALPFTIGALGSYLGSGGTAVAGLILASSLLVLSLYWNTVRSFIMAHIQTHILRKQIAAPEVDA